VRWAEGSLALEDRAGGVGGSIARPDRAAHSLVSQHGVVMPNLFRRLLYGAAHFALKTLGRLIAIPVRRKLRHFFRATEDCAGVQHELLRRILARQTDTAFGRDHHFASIRTVEDYRNNLPVVGYDALE